MRTHLIIQPIVFIGLLVLLAHCANRSNQPLSIGNSPFGPGEGFGDTSVPGGIGSEDDFNLDSFEGLDFEEGNIPQSVQEAQQVSNTLGSTLDQLVPGVAPKELHDLLDKLEHTRKEMERIAKRLREDGFLAAALAFLNEAHKVDVHRLYHPNVVDHFHTTNKAELLKVVTTLGYQYEGIGFQVYDIPWSPNQQNKCAKALYRCLMKGKLNHFVSAYANCNGQKPEGRYGYVCDSKRDFAPYELRRAYHKVHVNHIATMNPAEITKLPSLGYTVEGILGFPPI